MVQGGADTNLVRDYLSTKLVKLINQDYAYYQFVDIEELSLDLMAVYYVSQANEKDVLENEDIKKKFVPGLRVGKTGLEKAFEKELLGENDIQRFEVNAYGKKINQIELQKGSKGKNIRLTIDTEIQKYCSELLKDRAGSICVMDIYTGEIIAMQSAPSFDPNLFLFGINQDDWQLIRNNPLKPLVNKITVNFRKLRLVI